ncbi:MAG: dihydrodipicolinate reductase [Actinomycetia bacterium]|nr:dihydrodipicolinate reductase [Actinomycetes bacterium]
MMGTPVGVWGTGNMGRAAIRAVLGHPQLDLATVVTSSADKVGVDAAVLAASSGAAAEPVGVGASGRESVLEAGCAAVAYMASGDVRPDDAAADVQWCLSQGVTVVTPSLYALYDPDSAPAEVLAPMHDACRQGSSRLFVSGVDPGWGNDVLALFASGLCHSITEVRSQEIFDYSTYDQEFSVRELVGMGKPMHEVPPMVAPGVPTMVWGGQVRMLARALEVELDAVEESLERVALDDEVTNAMGSFAAGTQGALRFEVKGVVGDRTPIVIEHVTRIDPSVAPQWPQPASGAGSHRVVIEGEPRLEVTIEAEAEGGNRAAGGNATAAMRLVGAVPWLLERPAGVYDASDVPVLAGAGRLVGQPGGI